VGPRGAFGLPDPRQLVADRDRRHHDRQLPPTAHQAGLDGRPLPGIEAAIVERNGDGTDDAAWSRHRPDREGELALRSRLAVDVPRLPRSARALREGFVDGWYLSATSPAATPTATSGSSDARRRDQDRRPPDRPVRGRSALLEHPAVAEAGVIGKPDPTSRARSSRPSLRSSPATRTSDELHTELIALARKRLGAAVAPREIEFVDDLPKTRSGKIMRRLLKARELGSTRATPRRSRRRRPRRRVQTERRER
jgi:acetyl-CoA synthetase